MASSKPIDLSGLENPWEPQEKSVGFFGLGKKEEKGLDLSELENPYDNNVESSSSPSMFKETGRAAMRGIGQISSGLAGPLVKLVGAEETGEAIQKAGEHLEEKYPASPNLGIAKRAITGGVESMPSSVAAGIPGAIAGAAIGSLGGPAAPITVPIAAAIGYALSGGTLIGLAEYQNYKDEYQKEFGKEPDADVKAHAALSGLAEGGFEALSDVIGGGAIANLSGGKAIIKSGVKNSIRNILHAPVKDMAKAFGQVLGAETSTEAMTAFSEAALRKREGLPTMEPIDAALEAVGPAGVMSVLFMGGGVGLKKVRTNRIEKSLSDPTADEGARARAAGDIYQEIINTYTDPNTKKLTEEGQATADSWQEYSRKMIAEGKPIDLNIPLDSIGVDVANQMADLPQQKSAIEVNETWGEPAPQPAPFKPNENPIYAPPPTIERPYIPEEEAGNPATYMPGETITPPEPSQFRPSPEDLLTEGNITLSNVPSRAYPYINVRGERIEPLPLLGGQKGLDVSGLQGMARGLGIGQPAQLTPEEVIVENLVAPENIPAPEQRVEVPAPQNIFSRMPDDQLKSMADNGVQGAKDEQFKRNNFNVWLSEQNDVDKLRQLRADHEAEGNVVAAEQVASRLEELGKLHQALPAPFSQTDAATDFKLKTEDGSTYGNINNNAYDYAENKEVAGKTINISTMNAKEQGKGQGKKLLSKVIEYAKEKNIPNIGTISANQYAKNMFKSFEDKGILKPIAKGADGNTIAWAITPTKEGKAGESLKEPWQQTKDEFFNKTKEDMAEVFTPEYLRAMDKQYADRGGSKAHIEYTENSIRQGHKDYVEKALSEGKPVPPEVLKDYPELAKQVAGAPEVSKGGEQELLAEARKYKTAEEFVNEISNKLYALNKEAKAYGKQGSSTAYRPFLPEEQNKLYTLKDSLVKKYAEETGEYHKFGRGEHPFAAFWNNRGVGKLYKLGENTFHLFEPDYNFQENIGRKIISEFKNEIESHKTITGVNSRYDGMLEKVVIDFEGKGSHAGTSGELLEKLNKIFKQRIIDEYSKMEIVSPPRENIKNELTKNDILLLENIDKSKADLTSIWNKAQEGKKAKPPITNQEQLKQRLAEGKRLAAEKRAEVASKPITPAKTNAATFGEYARELGYDFPVEVEKTKGYPTAKFKELNEKLLKKNNTSFEQLYAGFKASKTLTKEVSNETKTQTLLTKTKHGDIHPDDTWGGYDKNFNDTVRQSWKNKLEDFENDRKRTIQENRDTKTPRDTSYRGENEVSLRRRLRDRRFLDEEMRGADQRNDKQRWQGVKISPTLADTTEFKLAEKHFADLGYQTVPITKVPWGMAVNSGTKVVFMGEMSGDRFAYFMAHETTHILSEQGNPSIQAIKNAVDLTNPAVAEQQKNYGWTDDYTRDEFAAAIVGGIAGSESVLKSNQDENIKAAREATGNRIKPAMETKKPTFYSQLEKVVTEKLSEMPAKIQSIPKWLERQGVKPAEMKWMGVEQWLAENQKDGRIDKQAFADFLKENQIEIKEVTKEEKVKPLSRTERDRLVELTDKAMDGQGHYKTSLLNQSEQKELDELNRRDSGYSEDSTKFAAYQLSGGENYKELLLTLPESKPALLLKDERERIQKRIDEIQDVQSKNPFSTDLSMEEERLFGQLNNKWSERNKINYKSAHWDEPNVVAHVRMNDRTDAEGNKVLFLEEVQSDWHQEGKKKGYKGDENLKHSNFEDWMASKGITDKETIKKEWVLQERSPYWSGWIDHENFVTQNNTAVPQAPFADNWHEMVMKKMLRYAAENGYDKIAWTDAEKEITKYGTDRIAWKRYGEDGWNVSATELSGGQLAGQNLEQYAREKGVLLEDRRDVKNKDNLRAVIGKALSRERTQAELDALTDKIWKQMQTQPEGVHMPRYEGMKSFYDNLIPGFMNRYVKQWGGKVGETKIEGGLKDTYQPGIQEVTEVSVPSIPITPAMRESVMQGQPMYGDLKPLDYISSYIPDSLSSWFKQTSTNSIPPSDISQTNGTWEALQKTPWDAFMYSIADRQIDLRDMQKSIGVFAKSIGRLISDELNPNQKEQLFSSRLSKRTSDFATREFRQVTDEMDRIKATVANFDDYLHARHAEEANNYIRSLTDIKGFTEVTEGKYKGDYINENGHILSKSEYKELSNSTIDEFGRIVNDKDEVIGYQDGGSGMSTKDANDYLEALDPKTREQYEKIALMVDKITHKNAQLLVEYGVESQDTIDKWFKTYEHYVPLFREDIEERPGTGRGFSVYGKASQMRKGSEKKVVNILSNVSMQRERYLTKGEKNRIDQALVFLEKEFPNEKFWTSYKIPDMKTYVPRGQKVETAENVIIARIPNKETGKIEHIALEFNKKDDRAMRMVKALKNMDMDTVGEVMGAISKITRYVASINTQYNPVFGLTNFFRDLSTGLLNLSTTPIAGKQKEVAKGVLPAMKGIFSALRGDMSSAEAKRFEEYQLEGGQVGYRNLWITSEDRAREIEKELKSLQAGKPKQYLSRMAKVLSDYNAIMENAVRLSAYKVGIESGMTKEQAAVMAKNLTVNFNKKGQIAGQAGALYAFFNASVQGAVRMYETIKGPMGRKIIAGGIILGATQAMMLAAAGFKDEEPPEFVKERNIIIPIGGKKYITFPMPLGFNVIPNVGRILAEITLGGGKNAGVKMSNLIGMITETFNPLGSSGLSMQTVAPTFLDPFAALDDNKDWTGRPIYKKDFNALNPTPGTSRVKDSATVFGRGLAWAFNILTGGDKYTPGMFSPTPDQIDYLGGQALGGAAREVGKISMLGESLYTGNELPTYKLPLTGRFYGSAEGQANESSKYYSNLKKLNIHEENIKGRIKDREPVGEYIRDNPEAKLWRMANTIENTIGKIKKRKEIARTPEAKKTYDKLITIQQKRLNDMMERIGG